MKTLTIIVGWLIASAGFAALPGVGVRTVNSSSGQFVVRGPAGAQPSADYDVTNSAWLELDPYILAVTCERIKQALLRELTLADFWRGRIYLEITSAVPTNQAPLVFAKPYLDGWQYQVELAPWLEKPKLVSGLVQVLLLEIANRNAGLRSAEIPLWLSDGLAQELVNGTEADLVVSHPQRTVNLVNLSWQARQAVRRDPLADARGRLQTHAALSFGKLGEPLPNAPPEETWKTFQASAHLFVHELLRLPGGKARLVEMVYELPFYLNWQSAFLNAYRGLFPRLLDVEKWWAVTLTHFTGQDPTQAWAMPVALQKLDEALHPAVLVSAGRKDLPQRSTMSVQRIINEWDYLRQRIVLKGVAAQLLAVRTKTPPELLSLVENYRVVVENYLARRDKIGTPRALSGVPPLRADFLVGEVIKQLDELDRRRKTASFTDPPPASPAAQPAK